MKKLPLPVIIGFAVCAVVILVVVVFRSQPSPAGDTGNIKQLASGIIENNPKNAPPMPAGIDPTAGAMSMGAKKK